MKSSRLPTSALQLFSLSALFFAAPLSAQVDYAAAGVPYVQDFNTPVAAKPSLLDWSDNTTFPGWFAACYDGNRNTYTPPAHLLVTSGQGRNEIGFYLYRSDGPSPEAALGTQATDERSPGVGAGGIFYGVALRNRTDVTLTTLRLSYRVELWRLATAQAAQATLSVACRVGGQGLGEGAWSLVPGGVYTTPIGGEGPNGKARSLDGNSPDNSTPFVNLTLAGISIPPGETIWIRWFDVNNRLADHGIGIDDVAITLVR